MNLVDRPLRVAFFNAADRVSGAEILIRQTVEGLIGRGVEARIYAKERKTDLPYVHLLPYFPRERGVEVRFRHWTGGNDILFPSTLGLGWRSWIKDADVWHFHNFHGHYVSLPFLAMQSWRRPVVVSPVDEYLATGYCPYTMGCERFRQSCGSCPQILTMPYPGISRDSTRALLAMKRISVTGSRFNILLHTEYMAQHYSTTFVGRRPIERIYYGVDTQVFRPMEREACAQALGLEPSKRFVVGLVHSNVQEERKGFLPLLQMLVMLGEEIPARLEVLVVGRGSDTMTKYGTPQLKITAVPFLASPEELATALNLCDVLLYPTKAENLSLTCLSALACGVPVITSDIGGQGEAVSDGINGFLCDAGRFEQFAERVAQLAVNQDVKQRLSIAARQTALTKFDIRTYIDNLIAYYNRVSRRTP